MGHGRKISVIGLGYVGLPVAVAFGAQARVVGFDINQARIKELKNGSDRTREVDSAQLKSANIHYTSDPRDLREADFHIVAVPTPIDSARNPDFGRNRSAWARLRCGSPLPAGPWDPRCNGCWRTLAGRS